MYTMLSAWFSSGNNSGQHGEFRTAKYNQVRNRASRWKGKNILGNPPAIDPEGGTEKIRNSSKSTWLSQKCYPRRFKAVDFIYCNPLGRTKLFAVALLIEIPNCFSVSILILFPYPASTPYKVALYWPDK